MSHTKMQNVMVKRIDLFLDFFVSQVHLSFLFST